MTSSRSSTRRAASRELNGSSRSTTLGSMARARARATRCCWPPDSWCGYRRPSPSRPTSSSREPTRPRSRRSIPKPMLRATVRWGKRAPSWGTYPTPRCWGWTAWRPSSTVRPPMVTEPASTRSKPAITRSMVVLPLPDSPRTARREPSSTVRSTSRSTGVSPNRLPTVRSSMELMWASSGRRAPGRTTGRAGPRAPRPGPRSSGRRGRPPRRPPRSGRPRTGWPGSGRRWGPAPGWR